MFSLFKILVYLFIIFLCLDNYFMFSLFKFMSNKS